MAYAKSCPLGPAPYLTCATFAYTTYNLCASGYRLVRDRSGPSSIQRRHLERLAVSIASLGTFIITFGKKDAHLPLQLGSQMLIAMDFYELRLNSTYNSSQSPTQKKVRRACEIIIPICMTVSLLQILGISKSNLKAKEYGIMATAFACKTAHWILSR